LEGARSALLEYGKRTPDNPNGFDSLGEVHYLLGHFSGAEKYFLEAARMDPSFLGGAPGWKAAHARLMTGDISGADAIVKSYFDVLRKQKDPLLDYRRALWEYETGRRSRAFELTPKGPAAPLMRVQRAIWLLEQGEGAKAREEVEKAISDPSNPQSQSLAMIALFLTQPPASAAEWKSRAAKAFAAAGEDPVQRLATAYALVLGSHFEEAVPLLKASLSSVSPPANGTLQFLLGWALVESGKVVDAAPYLATYPVPQPGVDVFGGLAHPRIFRLQAAVLEKQGKGVEAARKLETFKKLSGGT
jgi:tetratricopeptide (TPR) repeat protein